MSYTVELKVKDGSGSELKTFLVELEDENLEIGWVCEAAASVLKPKPSATKGTFKFIPNQQAT